MAPPDGRLGETVYLIPPEATACVTNAVVAILVVLSPAVAVGAVGVQVSAGLARGANGFIALAIAMLRLDASVPILVL